MPDRDVCSDCDAGEISEIDRLIAASSLGTPEFRAIADAAPEEAVRRILERVRAAEEADDA